MALRHSTVAGILSDARNKLIQAIGRVRDNTDLLRQSVIPADQQILRRMIDEFIEANIKTQAEMERISALYQRMIDTLVTGDTLYSDADQARFLEMFHKEGNIPDPMIEFIDFFEKLTLLPAGSIRAIFGTDDDRLARASEKLEGLLSGLIKDLDLKCFICPMFPLTCPGEAVGKG